MPNEPIFIDEPIPDNLRMDSVGGSMPSQNDSAPMFIDEVIPDNLRITEPLNDARTEKQIKDVYAQEIKAYTPETDPNGIKASVLVEPYKVPFDDSGSIYFGYENMTPHQQVDRMKRVINPYDQDVEHYMTELERVQKKRQEEMDKLLPAVKMAPAELSDDEMAKLKEMTPAEANDYLLRKDMDKLKESMKTPSQKLAENYVENPDEVIEAHKETSNVYDLKAKEIFLKNKLDLAEYYQQKYNFERPQAENMPLLYQAWMQSIANSASFIAGVINTAGSVIPEELVPDAIENASENLTNELIEAQNYMSQVYQPNEETQKRWKEGEGELWKIWKYPDRLAYMLVENVIPMIMTMAAGAGSMGAVTKAKKLQMIESALYKSMGSATKFKRIYAMKKALNSVSYGMGSAFVVGMQNAGDAVKEAELKGATPEEKQQIAQEVFIKDFTMNSFANSVQFGSLEGVVASKAPFWKKMFMGAGVLTASGIVETETELRENEHQQEALAARGLANIEKIDPAYYPRFVEALYDPQKRDIATYSMIMGSAEPIMGAYYRIKQDALASGKGKASLDTVTNFINKKNKEKAVEISAIQNSAQTPVNEPVAENLSDFERTMQDSKRQAEAQFDNREREIRTKYADDIETRDIELMMLNAERAKKIEEWNSIAGFASDGRVSEEAKQKIMDLTDPTEKATGDEINEVVQAMSGMSKEEFFRMRNEDIVALREKLGLNEITKAQAITFNDIFTNSETLNMSERANDIAHRIHRESKNRLDQTIPISVSERAGMLMESNKLQQRIQEKMLEADRLRSEGKQNEALAVEEDATALMERFDNISNAMSKVQSAAGTFLGSIRMKLTPEGNLYTAIKAAEKVKNAPLDPKTKEAFIESFKEIEKLRKEIDTLEENQAQIDEIYEQIVEEADEAISDMTADVMSEKTGDSASTLTERIINDETLLSQKSDRVSDMADLDEETKLEIQNLAELYIEEIIENGGKPDAKELLERFKEVLPDVSDIQLLDAFSGRRKKAVKEKLSQYKQMEKDLKKQSKLLAQIEEAIEGEFDPFVPPDPNSELVIKLQDELQKLKNHNAKTETDPRKRDFYNAKINELQDILFDYERLGVDYWNKKRKVQAEDSTEIRALKKKALELQRKIRKKEQAKTKTGKKSDEAKIADMKQTLERLQKDIDNLKQGKFPEKVEKPRETKLVADMRRTVRELRSLLHTEIKLKKINDVLKIKDPKERNRQLEDLRKVTPRPVPKSEELLKKRMELNHLTRTVRGMIEDAKTWKDMSLWLKAVHVAGLFRTLKLTSDTPVLRQGKFTMWRDPVAAGANFAASMEIYGITMAKGREAGYKLFNDIMYEIENDPLWTEMQQVKLPITDPHSGMSNREEIMTYGKFAEKIPIKRKGEFLDNPVVIGSELAYTAYLNLERVKYYKMLVQPGMTLEEKQMIARYVGTATGRGTFKAFERHALTASQVLLAPRWYVANIQMAGGILFTEMFWKSETVRKAWYRDVGTHIVSRVAFIALGVAAGGNTEWEDVNDPLFGKLKIGNTVIDPWGGSLWVWKTIAGTAQNPGNAWEIADRQMRYKLNPIISLAFTEISGKDVTGQEIHRGWNIPASLTPIMLSNFYEAVRNEQYLEAPLQLGIDFMGGSSYIQSPKKKRKGKKSRQQNMVDQLL